MASRAVRLALAGLVALCVVPLAPSLPHAAGGAGTGPPRACPPRRPLLLRGGQAQHVEFGQYVEGGNVESALADPEMTKVRAFMPKELRSEHGIKLPESRREFDDFARELVRHIFAAKCWFYPLPPWGRKDVYKGESGFLRFWHCVMGLSVFYVAAVEPFRCAGFAMDLKREKPHNVHDLVQICENEGTSGVDMVVNIIFLLDMYLATHTAFYKPLGCGRFQLVDDVI